MDKKVFSIVISEEDCNKLRRAHTEFDAYKDSLSHMVIDLKADVDTPEFTRYNQLYLKAADNYYKAQHMIESTYRPEETKGHLFKWSLDYATRVIVFTQVCDCEDLSVKCTAEA